MRALFTLTRISCGVASGSNRHICHRMFSSSPSAQATWGFIGLGRMGYPMAKNLRLKMPSGDHLIVQDINKDVSSRFAQEVFGHKVVVADNAREVAEKSETIITALPEPQHVKGVYKGMLEPPTLEMGASSEGRLFIDCSTIDPMTSSKVANAATTTGQGKFVDAPMSGGVVGAEAAALTFMIGAPPELVDRATKVLSMMGRRVLHMGGATAGLKAKLANNYLLALNNIATCEAMNMGIQWGLDPKALASMINISTGRCWPSEVNNPVPGVIEGSPASRGYDGGFGVGLMNKDLRLALQAAREFNVRLFMGQPAKELYDQVEKDPDCKGRDFSVIYRYLRGKE